MCPALFDQYLDTNHNKQQQQQQQQQQQKLSRKLRTVNMLKVQKEYCFL